MTGTQTKPTTDSTSISGWRGFSWLIRLQPEFWWNRYAPCAIIIPFGFAFYFSIIPSITDIIAMLGAFFLLYSGTFALNYLTDIHEDAFKPTKGHNPILLGAISKTSALFIVLVCGVGACLIALIFFKSLIAITIIGLGFLASISYSLWPRFKVTLLAPVIASLFHLGPPFVIFFELGVPMDLNILLYCLLMFFTGLYVEIDHSLYDLAADRKAKIRSFAVRVMEKSNAKTANTIRIALYWVTIALAALLAGVLKWYYPILILMIAVAHQSKLLDWRHIVLVFYLALFWTIQLYPEAGIIFVLGLYPIAAFLYESGYQLTVASKKLYWYLVRSLPQVRNKFHQFARELLIYYFLRNLRGPLE